MKDDPFFGEARIFRQPKGALQFVLPAALIATIALLDVVFVPWVSITPVACTITICWIALSYRPKMVAFWAVVFVCIICVVLAHDAKYHTALESPGWTVFLRTIGSAVSGTMALAISIYRLNLNRSYHQVLRVLEKMPVPIIVSDESGTINYINDEAADLLGVPVDEAPGHSYFSFLSTQTEKGKSIQRYLQIFDSTEDEAIRLRIHLRRYPNKLMSGMLMGFGRGNDRRLVTVIREGPEIPKWGTMPFIR